MAKFPLDDIEELTLCSSCKRGFDENERLPKLLECKHYFCLECVSGMVVAGGTMCCMHCYKSSAPPAAGPAAMPTHGPVLALARLLAPVAFSCAAHALPALWCAQCYTFGCYACPDHASHAHMLHPAEDGRAQLERELHLLQEDMRRLNARRHFHSLSALDAVNSVKMRLESELAAPPPSSDRVSLDAASFPLAAVVAERNRLLARHKEMLQQCRIDDALQFATVQARGRFDPDTFLVHYCTARLHARSRSVAASSPVSAPPRPAISFPQFYFEMAVDGVTFGRVVIEVRDDAAPNMARNFALLVTGELGFGYRGCSVFQCWENESIITGDFEVNTGHGGYAAFEEKYFMPDATKMVAVRGAVGMRRSTRRPDTLGLVGSQFRIMLRERAGFTAIFGYVVEGLQLVDRLSRLGDSTGTPRASITIANCGKLN